MDFLLSEGLLIPLTRLGVVVHTFTPQHRGAETDSMPYSELQGYTENQDCSKLVSVFSWVVCSLFILQL